VVVASTRSWHTNGVRRWRRPIENTQQFSSTTSAAAGNSFALFDWGSLSGLVDAADYVVWRNHLGAPAGALPNDVDGGPLGTAQYAT
jgi:hypothetical protein